ncbi:MAG: hypothetical protein Q7K03_06715 [Dehalococcoidia bacterium]|nr:hypothetical protein [Dehalococcoidia bacterium]
MTVPLEDSLCRFLDPQDWNYEDDCPAFTAFRASRRKLSLWHKEKIEAMGDKLDDLCFSTLKGFGHGLLTASDCIEAAQSTPSPNFSSGVYWRPSAAEAAWGQWRDAHVQVESVAGDQNFPKTYRLELARRCQVVKRPAGL